MSAYRIGVDLGGTNIKVGLLSEDGALMEKLSGKTDPFHRSWQEVVADIAGLIVEILSRHGVSPSACEKIGIGSPGLVDSQKGEVVFAGNLGWEHVPVLEELAKLFDVPLALANDADCAVLGEVVAGAAKGAKNVVLLTLGTGVGGGVVIDGRPQGGGPGRMEYGHMVIVADGEPCTCGALGCFEAYASATALVRQARRAAVQDRASALWELCGGDLAKMSGRFPFIAARQGDQTAQSVVDDYVKYVGIGVVNAINIWRPDVVLLGGGIANEGDPLVVPVAEYARPRVFAGERGYIAKIAQARLGNDAGLYGAANL